MAVVVVVLVVVVVVPPQPARVTASTTSKRSGTKSHFDLFIFFRFPPVIISESRVTSFHCIETSFPGSITPIGTPLLIIQARD
jgi:hypothetical protein